MGSMSTGPAFSEAFLKAWMAQSSNENWSGVNRVERTVDYGNLELLYGIAGKNTVLHRSLEALLD